MNDVAIIGAGPAGLMAAEVLAQAGRRVTVYEAKPSAARKFLMAGKTGLNLTRDEPMEHFLPHYGQQEIAPIIANFGPAQVMDWARGLGVELFTGSTGRVFPTEMKASPLLRAWLKRLDALGVTLQTRWRWQGWNAGALRFETPQGPRDITASITILALGGASWPRLGSDAAWVPWLEEKGVDVAPFRPANMGFSVDWSQHMAPHFGTPIKGAALNANGQSSRGEFVLTARGIEGGAVYAISAAVRDGATLTLDLLAQRSHAEVLGRLARPRGRETLANWLRKTLHLDPAKLALLQEWAHPLPRSPEKLAHLLKALPVPHAGPRPIAEAISSAGGVRWSSLTESLELRQLPGVYVIGEMLDWEAPTGGYLLTGCFATARHAAKAAARR
jgi:uncharacterized flavoprotein (TIGR03862 family)